MHNFGIKWAELLEEAITIKMRSFLIIGISLFAIIGLTSGHGMVMDPINRSSRWRIDPTAVRNDNDNENYCGGFGVSIALNPTSEYPDRKT